MKKDLFIVMVTLGIILGNTTITNINRAIAQQTEVKFADPVLENMIREQLKINKTTPLTVDKLAKITSLKIENESNKPGQPQITLFTGIENLKNLTWMLNKF
ncbi:MAG TPA: hypothetical protein V6C58_17025 [Allocoleopsis sp.]